MLDINKYEMIPDDVLAVRITDDNIEEIAAWSGFTIGGNREVGRVLYMFRLNDSYMSRLNDSYISAHIGDWVIRRADGVFTHMPDVLFKSKYQRITNSMIYQMKMLERLMNSKKDIGYT